ncbi:unnamed protein product [Lactuca saligna]|uniref:Caspase family p10 domain-containing protein n=1 Tax=Lactuca saligna TaxID=75948 RepID=A0AA35ZLZ6_LACSI|nr:unnamed protein product [Lactuca saligna]
MKRIWAPQLTGTTMVFGVPVSITKWMVAGRRCGIVVVFGGWRMNEVNGSSESEEMSGATPRKVKGSVDEVGGRTNEARLTESRNEDILSRFLQLKYKDPKYLRDIILNYVLAGKDPIGLTMSWFIYLLCKHPQVQEKVAKDIKEATEVKEEIKNIVDFAAYVSEGALKKMQYLHAALTETIRLYPALPLDPKICFSDDVLPDGYHVKKGDVVAYLPYAMGRMEFIWGDDAHEYKPKRWLDENGNFHPENPFKFTAFQAGPRTCLGRDFAYMQMKIFSSILLGCFVFKLSDVNRIPRYKTSINLHIDGPLDIRVFKRFG